MRHWDERCAHCMWDPWWEMVTFDETAEPDEGSSGSGENGSGSDLAAEVLDDAGSPAELDSGIPDDADPPLRRSARLRPMWTLAKSGGEDGDGP